MTKHLKLHSFTASTDHDFTGLVSGQILIFNGTDIVSTGSTSTSGDLWSASTGSNSIIANNGTGNLASGSFSVAMGQGNTASGTHSFIGGGYQNSTTTNNSSVVGGVMNLVSGNYSSIIGGSGLTNSYEQTLMTKDFIAIGNITGNTIHAEEFFSMVPYDDFSPASPNNNDVWFNSGATGTITLNYRLGGTNFSVELAP